MPAAGDAPANCSAADLVRAAKTRQEPLPVAKNQHPDICGYTLDPRKRNYMEACLLPRSPTHHGQSCGHLFATHGAIAQSATS